MKWRITDNRENDKPTMSTMSTDGRRKQSTQKRTAQKRKKKGRQGKFISQAQTP
jgi:hypothetical protein